MALQATARSTALNASADIDSFLAEVQTRAYRMANYAIRDPDEAMDIVQDAMIKLVSSYADRPA